MEHTAGIEHDFDYCNRMHYKQQNIQVHTQVERLFELAAHSFSILIEKHMN